MKNLVFVLIAMFCMTLTSCSFESDPIGVEILGSGKLQYDAQRKQLFVIIDSIRYYPQEAPTTEGMDVTVYTAPCLETAHIVAGIRTVEEIEQVYRKDYMELFLCILPSILIFAIGITQIFIGITLMQIGNTLKDNGKRQLTFWQRVVYAHFSAILVFKSPLRCVLYMVITGIIYLSIICCFFEPISWFDFSAPYTVGKIYFSALGGIVTLLGLSYITIYLLCFVWYFLMTTKS